MTDPITSEMFDRGDTGASVSPRMVTVNDDPSLVVYDEQGFILVNLTPPF